MKSEINQTLRSQRKSVAVGLLLLFTVLIPLQAEEQKKCTADPAKCEMAIRDMLAGQKYLGVELVNSGRGIVVRSLMPYSPAEIAGLRVGDSVLIIDGHDATTMRVRELKAYIEAAKQRGRVMMVIRRSGTLARVNVRFAVMQKNQIDKIVAAHMRESHSNNSSGN